MFKKPFMTLLSTAAIAAFAAASVPVSFAVAAPAASAKKYASDSYIVQLAERPVVTYDGTIKGLQATRPRKGDKIDPNSPQVLNYMSFLESRHAATIGSVGGARKLYSYGYSFNGFAADLTPEQAAKVAAMPGVVSVAKNELRQVETATTPAFLGLNAPGGLWDQLGGVKSAGEGVILGIVDSGVWPENLAYSDRTGTNGNATMDGKLDYQQIPGWHGRCIPGEAFNASNCNQKLIGARFYNEGWGGNAGIDATLPFEFNSPRDYNGHGSHTSSTAGGNNNVSVTGSLAFIDSISGIAPRARIAAYKACWSVPGTAGSCQGVDLLAAIDQAVADGVDVINYSISGTQTNFRDGVEIAFLNAASAGIFVAASAGNSGPASSTVAHPSPWITTVAAGTHDRNFSAILTLGNGITYTGASVTQTSAGPAPFIDSEAAGLPGADPAAVRLCFAALDNGGAPVLDPAKVTGKIVLCDRGVTNRVNKSLAVAAAGGIGMVLTNTNANSLNGDIHSVPTVHLADTVRAAIKAYAATSGATATIGKSFSDPVAAPFTASFSSRGPLLAGGGDLLKPDVIAPGQDILAAVAPPGNGGENFALYSGTSMSSPHVAGLAALLTDLHPTWSPMAIKSALMTSAYDVLDGGTPAPNTNPVLIFRQGAGHVRPNSAADPGLVYDSGLYDWYAFICATQPQGLEESLCKPLWSLGYSKNASDLNVASIAIGNLAGIETVTRKVTNVSGKSLTVSASLTGMAGFTTVVSPSSLTLKAGDTKSFTVAFTRTTADLNAYTGGQLTWTGGGYTVRSPIVVRPVALAAPVQVSGSYTVIFGYDGPFTATPRGLVPAVITAGTVADDPTDSTCSLASPNAQKIDVPVPAGTTYARFSLFDTDVNAGSDIDMCVFRGTTLVGSSGSSTSAEEVNLTDPAEATYTVVVQGWGVVGSSPFKLHTWLLGSAAAGNMAVSAPAAATTGSTGTISLSFSGLATGTKYLGSVAYGGVAGMPSPTIVRVDAP